MSNRPRRRPRQSVSRSTIEIAALLGARLRNCACDPNLELRHDVDGPVMQVRHDHWCPAVNTGRQLIITIPPRRPAP